MHKNYCIKEGYSHKINFQQNNIFFDNEEYSNTYQDGVYKFAQQVIKKYNLCSVLDIGCGFGIKLKKYIFPVCKDITGIDLDYIINFCKKTHSFGKWINTNIENDEVLLNKKFDLIICSDIIEHLFNPNKLLDYLKKISHDTSLIVISTPERDLVHGKKHNGPPSNNVHIREWNNFEFKQYLLNHQFKIIKYFLVQPFTKKGLIGLIYRFKLKKSCQVFLCKKA